MHLHTHRRSLRSRRAVALALAAGLTASLATAPPAGATDPSSTGTTSRAADAALPADLPVRLGARWLRGRLVDGQLVSRFEDFTFVDTGLSIDAGLAFETVGARAALAEVANAVLTDEVLASYTSFEGVDYGGALGKASTFAAAAGSDPSVLGGNLVARLEALVADGGAADGRVLNTNSVAEAEAGRSDFASTFSQVFAVAALDEAGSSRAGDATSYLLAQQCAGTGFRGSLPAVDAPAEDIACGDPASASVDATALALRLLLPQADDASVLTALVSGTSWLLDQQATDGGYGGGASGEGGNANSTGLSGWALGELSAADVLPADLDAQAQESAALAALWVRTRQAADPSACRTRLTPQTGAIAYDQAGLAAGREQGFGALADQFVRASAQALPALAFGEFAAAAPRLTQPSRFVRAGEPAVLRLSGVEPGQVACFAGRLVIGDGTDFERTVRTPRRTSTVPVEAVVLGTGGPVVESTLVRALAGVQLSVSPALDTVRRGDDLRVVVSGLEPREPVVVRIGREVVATGMAAAGGRFTRTVEVDAPRGRTRVVATGAFADLRRGSAALRVR